MEDDIDIYGDLPGFEPGGNEVVPRKGDETVTGEQLQLKKQIVQLTEKLETFRKLNENLENNLFSLLKTAKAEIARKDNMIDDLRRKLDDIAFRRGAYRMAGNNRKAAPREAAKIASRESPCGYLYSNDVNLDAPRVDPPIERDRAKDRQSKPTLIPNTVFGKRLLERIADEQKLERREEPSGKFARGNGPSAGGPTGPSSASGSGSGRTAEGYVVESDKENGLLGDTNLLDANEKAKGATKDAEFHGKAETSFRPERKAALAATVSTASPASIVATGKRANDDSGRHAPAKRLKSSHESYSPDATPTFKEAEVKEAGMLSRHPDLRSSVRCSERRHSLKMSDAGYASTSSAEWKRSEYLLEDAKKSRGIRDSDKRGSRRRDRSVENSTLPLDKRRATSRSSELSDRDHYRSSRGEHGRTKAREYRRSDDHRSRLKPLAYEKPSREEKHGKNQYSKKPDYQENLEKGYNFRSSATSTSKSRLCKKDWSSVRDVKKDVSCDDQQPRKLRPRSADKLAKRPNSSPCKTDPVKSTERVKRSEASRRGGEKEKEREKERGKGKGKKEEKEEAKELQVHEELEKYAKEELQSTSIELEEGEISNTSSDWGGRNTAGEKQGATDRPLARNGDGDRHNFAGSEDALCNVGTSAPTCSDQRPPETPANNESAENLENIEKFIRDYKSVDDPDKTDEKVAPTSDTICAALRSNAPSNKIESPTNREAVDISSDPSSEQRNVQVEHHRKEKPDGTPESAGPEIVSESKTKRETIDFSTDAATEQRDVLIQVEVEKKREEDRTPVLGSPEIVSPKLSTPNGTAPSVARVSESTPIKREHDCLDEMQIEQPFEHASDIPAPSQPRPPNCVESPGDRGLLNGPPGEQVESSPKPNPVVDPSWILETPAKPQLIAEDSPARRRPHSSSSKKSSHHPSHRSSKRINANGTVATDCSDSSDRSQGKTNVSNGDERAATDRSRSSSRSLSRSLSRSGSAGIALEAAREKGRDREVRSVKKARPGPKQPQSINRNGKPAAANVPGKIVMVVRRTRPVCLADSDADMTVVISDSWEVDGSEESSITTSTTSPTSPTYRNSIVKYVRSNGCHAPDAS